MDWKVLDEKGVFLKEVNCEYDACDISQWEFGASSIRIDFENKEATILSRGGDVVER